MNGEKPPQPNADLPQIPLVEAGGQGAPAVFDAEPERAARLLDAAERRYGAAAIRIADKRSRAWLVRNRNPWLAEIEAVAARVGRPGAFMLNLSFEWTCTAAVGPDPDQEPGGARLLRTLDWPLEGLGQNLVVARHDSAAGPYFSAAWPGFVGALTVMAPGRFAASINQPPALLTRIGPINMPLAVDWFLTRRRVLRSSALPPTHLLRQVCEEARDFAEARRMLTETPVCIPVFFALCGMEPLEGCVIERLEKQAFTFEAPACAANHWLTPGRTGRLRTKTSPERLDSLYRCMETARDLEWLAEPVLNAATRLAAVANPRAGTFLVQGFEADGAVTAPTSFAGRAPS